MAKIRTPLHSRSLMYRWRLAAPIPSPCPAINTALICSADQTSFTPYMTPTICIIFYSGKVWCVPPSTHTASCSADLTSWPYDRHTCKLEMGSWTHTGEKVNVSLQEPGVSVKNYYSRTSFYEWDTSFRHATQFYAEQTVFDKWKQALLTTQDKLRFSTTDKNYLRQTDLKGRTAF